MSEVLVITVEDDVADKYLDIAMQVKKADKKVISVIARKGSMRDLLIDVFGQQAPAK